MTNVDVCDGLGNPLRIGGRVADDMQNKHVGTITRITELDGDNNEEGRPVAVYPRVTVLFDDGTEGVYTTTTYGTWETWMDCIRCDDLGIVP